MPEFLVEAYIPRDGVAVARASDERARMAAEELIREGASIRFVRSVFVPEDETCFFLYEADSLDTMSAAAALLGIPVDRVSEAVAGPAQVGRTA